MMDRANAVLFFFLMTLGTFAVAQDEFLDPELAFVLQVTQDDTSAQVHWDITPGYKLYRDRTEWDMPGLDSDNIVMPPAEVYYDDNFGEDMAVYHEPFSVSVPLPRLDADSTLRITYQGCADAGLCYPPITKEFVLRAGYAGVVPNTATADDTLFGSPQTSTTLTSTLPADAPAITAQDETSVATRMLESRNLWTIGAGFLLFGLLLSFTPCVLPMVPILFSIIVGMEKDGALSRGRSFSMAMSYSLGMALVYTGMGITAGLLGEGLAAYLQAPWLLTSFAILLVLFSLSMFDVYQLQMPASLQSRLDSVNGHFKGGKFLSVFLIGAVSALIVGPCVAAPLAGALIYISQSGDVTMGGVALFCMAMGMSVPLLLTGLSAGSLLPRAGQWMTQLKVFFGLVLLAVAIWMVTPVLPGSVLLLLWGALAILGAMYLGIFDGPTQTHSFRSRFTGMLAMCLLLIGLAELVGAVSGAQNPLQPLALAAGGGNAAPKAETVRFRRVASIEELQQVVAASDRPVMLDFYADWCVSCKEMERFTFSDPQVAAQMSRFTLLQADVTDNNADDRVLLKTFGLFGPPGILFFEPRGGELSSSRVIGFAPADKFLATLDPLVN